MATTAITRKFLSASTNGKGILVLGTGTGSSVAVHVPSTNKDALHIWASNPHTTTDITVTIEMAGVASPGDVIKRTIPALSVLKVVDGITLGSLVGTINAFADTGSYITLFGHVNEVV